MHVRLFLILILSSIWIVAAQRSSTTSTKVTRTSTSTSTKTSTKASSTSSPTTLKSSASSTRSSTTEKPNSSEPPDPTSTSTTSSSTETPTGSPAPINGPIGTKDGLSRNDVIGLSLGIPMGVIALAGLIFAFLIRKRRQRDRRFIDPQAGAGKRIYDPSPELVVRTSNPTAMGPGAVELPTVRSDQWTKASNHGQNEWWRVPLGSSTSTTKYSHVGGNNNSQSPQELAA